MTIPDAEINITYVDGGQAVAADVQDGVGILYPGMFTIGYGNPYTIDYNTVIYTNN